MDSFSFLESLAKATQGTMSYVPLDNEGKCPYCMNPAYETKREIHEVMDEVKCLNCHRTFFPHPIFFKKYQ